MNRWGESFNSPRTAHRNSVTHESEPFEGHIVEVEPDYEHWLHWDFTQGSGVGLIDLIQEIPFVGGGWEQWFQEGYERFGLYHDGPSRPVDAGPLTFDAAIPTPPGPWRLVMIASGRLSDGMGIIPDFILSDGGDEDSPFGLWGRRLSPGSAPEYKVCGSAWFDNINSLFPDLAEYVFDPDEGVSIQGTGGEDFVSVSPTYPNTLRLRVPINEIITDIAIELKA